MNTNLRNTKDFKNDFFKLIKNVIFGKAMEKTYARKYTDIKNITVKRKETI